MKDDDLHAATKAALASIISTILAHTSIAATHISVTTRVIRLVGLITRSQNLGTRRKNHIHDHLECLHDSLKLINWGRRPDERFYPAGQIRLSALISGV